MLYFIFIIIYLLLIILLFYIILFSKTEKPDYSIHYFLDNESLYRLKFGFQFTWDAIFEA